MTKEEARKLIHKWEYDSNGMYHLGGTDIKIVNLRLNKKKAIAIADVILIFDCGDKIERYNNCEYNLEAMTKKGR